MQDLYFEAGLPVEAVRRLIEVARTEPVGVVAVDAALHIAGCLNAYRESYPIPFGSAEVDPEFGFEDLCNNIEARLPKDWEKEEQGYKANPILNALIAALVRKILERFLPVL